MAAGAFALLAIVLELKTSWLESLIFRSLDRKITFHLEQGPSQEIQYPQAGPYDWTLGYARMPDVLKHLEAAGYHVDAQVRDSHLASVLYRSGVYPVYGHKDQAGLRIRIGRVTFFIPSTVRSASTRLTPTFHRLW